MKLSAIVQEAQFKQTLVGVKEAATEFDKMAASQKRAAAAGDILAKQQDISEKSITRIGSKLEAYQRRFDPIHKALADVERGERLVAAARGRGIAVSDQTIQAVENARAKWQSLSGAMNDNSTATGLNRMQAMESIHVLKSFADSVAAGQSPLRALAVEGGRIAQIFTSGNQGVAGTLSAFGGILGTVLNPMTLFVGGLGAIGLGAVKTTSALAELAAQTEKIGVAPSAVMGANVVGARAGLDDKETGGALASANAQFEAFQRNSGAVLQTLNMIDKGFVHTLDSAKTLPQFIGMIGDEIKRLPPVEGLSLSRALLGDDAGTALFGSIGDLASALKQTSAPLDEAAKYAMELQRQTDAAAVIAHNDLLKAFEALTVPIHDLSLAFYSVESSIASAMNKAGQFYNLLRSYIPDWTSKSGWLEQPAASPDGSSKLPDISIGASRSRFAGYAEAAKKPRASGKSDAEKELETYEKITKELQDQIRLTSALGDAHKGVQAELDRQSWVNKLGKNATPAQRDTIGGLADQLQAAKTASEAYDAQQKMIKEGLDIAKSAAVDFGTSLVDAMRRGESGGKALMGVLQSLESKLLNKAMDSAISGIFDSVTKKDSGGGIFGALGSVLSSFLPGATPHAMGGVFGPGGSIPLHTYANGGVANSPQMAIFGEGRKPEAFVPLPDGRNIPVKMGGQQQGGAKITINNLHGGADVQAHETSTGEILITVQRMIDANNRKVPGIVANSQRRAM